MRYSLIFLFFIFLSCSNSQENLIEIPSEAWIDIPADIAEIQITIETSGSEAKQVLKKNNKKLYTVLQILKSFGYNEQDIETLHHRINENSDFYEQKGFSAFTQYQFNLHQIELIDTIKNTLVNNGVNQFRISNYSLSNFKIKEKEVYNKAIDIAFEKAKMFCSKIDKDLKGIVKVVDKVNFREYTNIENVEYKNAEIKIPKKRIKKANQLFTHNSIRITATIHTTFKY